MEGCRECERSGREKGSKDEDGGGKRGAAGGGGLELGLQSVAVRQNVGLKKKGDILEWVFIMIGSVCKDVLSSV